MFIEVNIDLPDGNQNYVLCQADVSGVVSSYAFEEESTAEVQAFSPVAGLVADGEHNWRPATEAEFVQLRGQVSTESVTHALHHCGAVDPKKDQWWPLCPEVKELP